MRTVAGNVRSDDAGAARRFCRAILPRVSRTFALGIRILPGELADAVTQAYLLCRIADTVEDSPHVPAAHKTAHLATYSSLFPLRDGWEERVADWQASLASYAQADADHYLCARTVLVFRALSAQRRELRRPIEACVHEMALGMRDACARRAARPRGREIASWLELSDYCHYVAGTVGIMLCRLFGAASSRYSPSRMQGLLEQAERFGLAMQLVNILQDVGPDASGGRFYVPQALVAGHEVETQRLLQAGDTAARAVLADLGRQAVKALRGGMEFTRLVPRRELRVRFFCLVPLFLAVRTLDKVLESPPHAGRRPKVGRWTVRRVLGVAGLAAFSNRVLALLFGRHLRLLEGRLTAGGTLDGVVGANTRSHQRLPATIR